MREGDGSRKKLSVSVDMDLDCGKGEGLGAAATIGSLSRRSSVMTAPSISEGGAHRLDLLIEEQTSAVKSAQEGLQQSLAILTRANSKEEKESARMQVQSLLTRAEELILLLRVISEIRGELGYIQREVQLARKNHSNPRQLYARQQWLEVRLEKLLLAKRRSRPGGGTRGLRTQARPSQIQRRLEPKGTSPNRSTSESLESFSDRDTILSVRDSIMAPSTAGAPVDSSEEEGEEPEVESQESERSEKRVDWATNSQSKKTLSQSSEDSDVWHSESEANWTLAGASFRNGRDMVQSQVLSEGLDASYNESMTQRRASVTFSEAPILKAMKEGLKDTLSPFREQDEEGSFVQTNLPASVSSLPPPLPEIAITQSSGVQATDPLDAGLVSRECGFDPPRPIEVFGSCSWNTIPLAVASSLVQQRKSSDAGSMKSTSASFALMLKTGLDEFCSEVEVLRKLIHDAAGSTAGPGPLEVTSRRAALSSHSASRPKNSRNASSPRPKSMPSAIFNKQMKSQSSSGALPQIASATSSSFELKKSRKVYGRRAASYPRTWSTGERNSKLPDITPEKAVQKQPSADLQASLRLRSRTRSWQKSRKSARSRTATTEVDIFDREMHKERRIEHLLHQTDSSLAAVRKSSIQELGMLPRISIQAEDKLHSILHTDEEAAVRYQALCSLLQLGILGKDVVKSVDFFLSKAYGVGPNLFRYVDGNYTRKVEEILQKGSTKLQADLLHVLCQDHVLKLCTDKLPHQPSSAAESLADLLSSLLATCDDGEGVALYSAVLLSHAHLQQEACLDVLKRSLQSSFPAHHNLALKCLLSCWKCSDSDTISSAMSQMSELRDWKLRKESVDSLCLLAVGDALMQYRQPGGDPLGSGGHRGHCKSALGQGIVEILTTRLANEPVLAVRVAIGRLLKCLNADTKTENSFLSDLESNNEVTRSNAVLALSAFELKSKKTISQLMESVELDPSMYIRIQVIRVFGEMSHYNHAVVQCLKKKCSGSGINEQEIIARESMAALQKICTLKH